MTKNQAINLLALLASLSPARILTVFFAPAATLKNLKKINREELTKFILFVLAALIFTMASREILLLNLSISLFFLLPFLLPLFFFQSTVSQIKFNAINKPLEIFFSILLVNGSIGVIQYIIDPNDDAAIGFHGRAGLQMHGLAILYIFSAIYFYNQNDSRFNITKTILSLIFFTSCFYGMGLVALIISAFITAILTSTSRLKHFGLLSALLVVLLTGLYITNKSAFLYNYNIIILFTDSVISIINNGHFQETATPRKLTAWLNYFQLISNDLTLFFTGVGGGNFNSRAAFMLNGDYSSISYLPISISEHHGKYIMPLWSTGILSQQYQDGSMNQPFSSILSIISEYGVIGFALIITCLLKARQTITKSLTRRDKNANLSLYFCFVFIFILGLFENIYEYPEIVFPFFVLIHWIALKAQYNSSRTCFVQIRACEASRT